MEVKSSMQSAWRSERTNKSLIVLCGNMSRDCLQISLRIYSEPPEDFARVHPLVDVLLPDPHVLQNSSCTFRQHHQ